MRKAVLFCAIILVAVGCSTKKNTATSRFYHSTTSKFNPLFNGEEALRYGLLDITQSYQDNYWLRLPVDPYVLPDPYDDEAATNEFFDRAQEKAILTVQKHSMLIKGAQHNKQIAKAYLILGKARYYNGKYLQAIEAFTYLIKNMANAEQTVEAELWRAKSYLAMGQHDRAIRELTNLTQVAALEPKQYAVAQAALADALLRETQDSIATVALTKAMATEKSAAKRGRYAYLLGQLYEDLTYADSAIVAYQNVLDLNRRIPRELWIHARLAQLQNKAPQDEKTLLAYRKLLRSDEDRRFRDKIHYFYGAYLLKGRDTLNGEASLKASLETKTQDRYLKSLIYEQLASNRLEQVAFVDAGAYLDSTLQNLTDKTRRFRRITRQRKKLDDIISYEKTIAETDSIMGMMRMTADEQKAVVEAYIQKRIAEKEKAEAEAKTAESGTVVALGNFYFYNSRQVERGKQLFQQTWVNVALADNWKYEPTKNTALAQDTKATDDSENTIDPEFDPQTYLAQIPPTEALDSLQQLQHQAYFQAGLAYKEQFKINAFAVDRFTSLLAAKPNESYYPPTYYHLFELHEGNRVEQQKWRAKIVSQYPDSDYAKIIENPSALAQTIEENEAALAAAKKQFGAQEFEAIIAQSERFIPQLTDSALQAKWALLRATALGRLDGLETYKAALTTLVQTYPKTESAKKAQTQLDGFEVYNTMDPSANEKAKWVLIRTPLENDQSQEDKKWLEEWLSEQGIDKQLRVSIDVFDRNTEILVVHGFSSTNSAKETAALVTRANTRLLASKNIVVLASQYRNAFVSKRLEQLEN